MRSTLVSEVILRVILAASLAPREVMSTVLLYEKHLQVLGPAEGFSEVGERYTESLTAGQNALPEFYHSYARMVDELLQLEDRCGLERQQKSKEGVTVDIYRLKGGPAASHRLFLLAGDHARELVGPEVAFAFVKELCRGGDASTAARVTAFREKVDVMVVLNGSPEAREAVERGAYCMRVNAKGVDLNRNWGLEGPSHFRDAEVNDDSGERNLLGAPLQPETCILQNLLKEYQPTVFVTLHSGSHGVYLPSGSLQDDPNKPIPPHQKKQQQLAEKLRTAACPPESHCEFGAVENFFKAKGNVLDWVIHALRGPDGDPPMALALEVYVQVKDNEQPLPPEEKAKAHLEIFKPQLAGPLPDAGEVADLLPEKTADKGGPDLIEWQLSRAPKERQSCFLYFNPATETALRSVIQQWLAALFTLGESFG